MNKINITGMGITFLVAIPLCFLGLILLYLNMQPISHLTYISSGIIFIGVIISAISVRMWLYEVEE